MSWWEGLVGNARQELELRRELEAHVEERVADLIRSGMPEAEARRRVRLEFGGLEQVGEECRDVRPRRWCSLLAKDVAYSVRGMRKRPALALTMVLTVAVCVSVNTAVFTVVDSLLLRPLPFSEADRLITMTNQYPNAGIRDQDTSSAGDLFDREGNLPAVAEQALYRFVTYPLDRGGTPAQMRGMAVTPSLFPLLRVRPAQGRLFTASEAERGRDRVVILTDGLWRDLFAGAPAVGKELLLNGRPYTVAGVLPAGFRLLDGDIRYFLPLSLTAEDKLERHANSYRYVARLRAGATIEQAQAQVEALNARLLDQTPAIKQMVSDAGFHTRVDEWQSWLVRHVRPSLHLLWAGAFLVLVIGASNLAGLSLARAHAQIPEIATRLALGATRGDVVRRSLVDGVLPAMAGGVLGFGGGVLAVGYLNSDLLPGTAEISTSPTVAAYALAGAVGAGVMTGFLSLFPLRGRELGRSMQDGSKGSTLKGAGLRRAFVGGQIALAFVLLSGAVALTASIRELLQVDPGFQVEGVWTASTYLPGATHAHAADLRATTERVISGIRELPGVELAGGGAAVPFGTGYEDGVLLAEGYTMKPGESAISPVRLQVTPGYLEVLGLPAIRGRLFDARDTSDSPPVVLIDERLARRFWPGRDPVGRRMRHPGAPAGVWLTVVGVVPSVRLEDLAGTGNPNGAYYTPWAQRPSQRLSVVWRGPQETAGAVRREVSRQAPGAAVFELRSMAERQEATLAAQRGAQALVVVFAGVAALLTAIGINGLLAFMVAQRQREIGIRLAIGCSPRGIFRLFLSEGASFVSAGLLGGLCVTVALRPWVARHLFGIAGRELSILAAVAALLVAVSAVAIARPAFRAARANTLRALREG